MSPDSSRRCSSRSRSGRQKSRRREADNVTPDRRRVRWARFILESLNHAQKGASRFDGTALAAYSATRINAISTPPTAHVRRTFFADFLKAQRGDVKTVPYGRPSNTYSSPARSSSGVVPTRSLCAPVKRSQDRGRPARSRVNISRCVARCQSRTVWSPASVASVRPSGEKATCDTSTRRSSVNVDRVFPFASHSKASPNPPMANPLPSGRNASPNVQRPTRAGASPRGRCARSTRPLSR